MKKTLLLFLVASMTLSVMHAQNANRPFGVNLSVGINEYSGDLGSGLFKFASPLDKYGLFGGGLDFYVNRSLNFGFALTLGNYGYAKKDDLGVYQDLLMGKKLDFNLRLIYKLYNGYFIPEDSWFAPAIFAGVGIAGYDFRDGYPGMIKPGNDLVFPVGLMTDFRLNDWFAFRLQSALFMTLQDERDFIVTDRNDLYMQHTAGVVFSIGESKPKEIIEITPPPPPPPPAPEPELVPEPKPEPEPEPVKVLEFPEIIVYFDFDRAFVKPEFHKSLDDVVRFMLDNPGTKFSLHGHTCTTGAEMYNKTLSMDRALGVARYMEHKGISRDRLILEGFGFSKPAMPNTTEANRSKNRRTEVNLVK